MSSVRLIRTGGNYGFVEASNIGVKYGRRAQCDSVFIINNNTLVLDNAFEEWLKFLNQPNVAPVGPCMKFLGQPTIIWACGGFINKYRITIGGITNINENKPYDVDYLPGAAILCKLEFWDLVQGLPEKYFLCFEEAEFALRLKHFNLRIVAVPTACILHRVGMSSDRQPMYIYNQIRNRIKFGQYLFGNVLGFLYATIISIPSSIKIKDGFRIWFSAVIHEIIGKPLDRKQLQLIKDVYKN